MEYMEERLYATNEEGYNIVNKANDFYLRRSRQVLELCKLLLLLLLLLGWLLLWGGAVCMSPFTIPYFGTINSLRGGIHQKMAISQYSPTDFLSMISLRGGIQYA